MKWSKLPLLGLALGLIVLAVVACSPAQGAPKTGATGTPDSSGSPAITNAGNPGLEAPGAASGSLSGPQGPQSLTGVSAPSGKADASILSAPGSAPSYGVGSVQSSGIWVTGTGNVSVKPDLALVYLGVQADGTTVAEARDKAASAMQSVMDALKALGIADNDIQTQYFSIQPKYSYGQVQRCVDGSGVVTPPVAPNAGTSSSGSAGATGAAPSDMPLPPKCYTDSQQVLVGYTVTNQVTVKVRNLDSVSKVVDNAAQAGGDVIRVNNVSFTVENDDAARSQARELAVKEALAKAQQLAELTNVTLGKLQYLSESYASTPIPYATRDAAMGASAPAVPTPISEGQLTVTATVQAGFAILD